MLRGEHDQSNPYAPFFVDDCPDHRTEDAGQRSMLRAAFLGFIYAHLAFIAGSPLTGAFFGAREPLRPTGLLFGLEGMKAAFFTVVVGYVYILGNSAVLLVSVVGIVNGIIVNYWQSHRADAFLLWCSAIDLLVVAWIVLASR